MSFLELSPVKEAKNEKKNLKSELNDTQCSIFGISARKTSSGEPSNEENFFVYETPIKPYRALFIPQTPKKETHRKSKEEIKIQGKNLTKLFESLANN